MCSAECLRSLEISHKFLGWLPRHLPNFNQSFFYFLYHETLHKIALDKKVLQFEDFFLTCSRHKECIWLFICYCFSKMDRTIHHWTKPFISCHVSLVIHKTYDVICSALSCTSLALFIFAISKEHKCGYWFTTGKSKGSYEIIYQIFILIQRLADC